MHSEFVRWQLQMPKTIFLFKIIFLDFTSVATFCRHVNQISAEFCIPKISKSVDFLIELFKNKR